MLLESALDQTEIIPICHKLWGAEKAIHEQIDSVRVIIHALRFVLLVETKRRQQQNKGLGNHTERTALCG